MLSLFTPHGKSTFKAISISFFFFLKYLFIYLTALGLSCSMWDLVS